MGEECRAPLMVTDVCAPPPSEVGRTQVAGQTKDRSPTTKEVFGRAGLWRPQGFPSWGANGLRLGLITCGELFSLGVSSRSVSIDLGGAMTGIYLSGALLFAIVIAFLLIAIRS